MRQADNHPDQLIQCHVLHRRDYTDTSLLLELFSAEHGRFPAIAKGAKRSRSGRAALLQAFQPLWVKLSGRGEVKTLAKVESAGSAPKLVGTSLYCGFYLNELLMRLLQRDDAHARLYGYYLQALEELAGAREVSAVLRRFEIRLLRETGYAMVLDRDASDRPVQADLRYSYVPEQGPVPNAIAGRGSSCSGGTLLALAAGQALDAEQSREARDLMRQVLNHYLGEKPLKSRELFRRP